MLTLLKKIFLSLRYALTRLEKGAVLSNSPVSLDEALDSVWSFIKSNLTDRDPNGSRVPLHLKTQCKSRRAHTLRAQTNLFLALENFSPKNFAALELQESLANYLVAKQENNGLFLYHHGGALKDKGEGPATNWTIIALVKAYEKFNRKEYLEAAVRAADGAAKYMYNEHRGFIHTVGQDFWCPNISVTFGYANQLLFEKTYEDRFKSWAAGGLKHTLAYQKENGLFPYFQTRQIVYLSLYQAHIIYFLNLLNKGLYSEWDVESSMRSGLSFLKSLINDDGSIAEPDLKHHSTYIISQATCTKVFLYNGMENEYRQCLGFLLTMLSPPGPFIYISAAGKGCFGDKKSQTDLVFSEVLYWLSDLLDPALA